MQSGARRCQWETGGDVLGAQQVGCVPHRPSLGSVCSRIRRMASGGSLATDDRQPEHFEVAVS